MAMACARHLLAMISASYLHFEGACVCACCLACGRAADAMRLHPRAAMSVLESISTNAQRHDMFSGTFIDQHSAHLGRPRIARRPERRSFRIMHKLAGSLRDVNDSHLSKGGHISYVHIHAQAQGRHGYTTRSVMMGCRAGSTTCKAFTTVDWPRPAQGTCLGVFSIVPSLRERTTVRLRAQQAHGPLRRPDLWQGAGSAADGAPERGCSRG